MDTTTQKDLYVLELRRCGLEATAATRAGMTPAQVRTGYNNDPHFKEAAENALEMFNDKLETEAIRRAMGYEVTIQTPEGERTEVRYSDRLMDKVLTGRRPDVYGNKSQITGPNNGPIQIAVSHFIQGADGEVKEIDVTPDPTAAITHEQNILNHVVVEQFQPEEDQQQEENDLAFLE